MAGGRGVELTQTESDVADALVLARAARRWPGADGGELAGWLYVHWYCGVAEDPIVPAVPTSTLAGRLTAAHAAGDRWEEGWRVVRVERDWLMVEKGGRERVVGPGDYHRPDRRCVPPSVEDAVAVTGRIHVVDEATGYWASQRDADAPSRPLVRVYWHVAADAVATVVRVLTGELEDAGIDYAMKAPANPGEYERVDALVLYLRRAEAPRAGAAVRTVLGRVGSSLGDRTPRLARRLAPGCAWAEDPPGDTSFGFSRCEAVASGMSAAARQGITEDAAAVAFVIDALASGGIDPARPHRNPPADDDLERSMHP